MEETGFSERNCYLKCLKRGGVGGGVRGVGGGWGDQFSCRKQILVFDPFIY